MRFLIGMIIQVDIMREIRKRLLAVFCSFVIGISSASVCFAGTQEADPYENVDLLETVVNTYPDSTAKVSPRQWEFAKCLGDIYFSYLFEKNSIMYEDVWEAYRQYKRSICDQNGDFRTVPKQEIANVILFATLFSIDARDICGYSLPDELLGEENMQQTASEGIESICSAYIALTCHDAYRAMSKAEQEYLLEKILTYSYEDIAEISPALAASANSDRDAELQKWQESRIDQLAQIYQNKACTTEEMAQMIHAASILGVDVSNDARFSKDQKNILREFYSGVASEIKQEKEISAEWLTNVFHALLSRENFLRQEDSLYFYGNRSLYADDNYISTEIYRYLCEESDIANHWSKQAFLRMILDSEIPYCYAQDKNISPNAAMTRGEFITWLSQAERMRTSDKNYFSDLEGDSLSPIVNGFFEECVFLPYHAQTQRKSFLSYYWGENFGADQQITREEAAFLIACTRRNMEIDPQMQTEDFPEAFSAFQDHEDCQERYVSAIQFCVGRRLMTGRGNRLDPKAALTRAEAVTLINGKR